MPVVVQDPSQASVRGANVFVATRDFNVKTKIDNQDSYILITKGEEVEIRGSTLIWDGQEYLLSGVRGLVNEGWLVTKGSDINEEAVIKVDVNVNELSVRPLSLDTMENEESSVNESVIEHYKREALGTVPRGEEALPDSKTGWAKIHWKNRVKLVRQTTDVARLFNIKSFETAPAVVEAIDKRLLELKA